PSEPTRYRCRSGAIFDAWSGPLEECFPSHEAVAPIRWGRGPEPDPLESLRNLARALVEAVPVDPPGEGRVPVAGLLADLLDGEALVGEEADEGVPHRVRRAGQGQAGGLHGGIPEPSPPLAGAERLAMRAGEHQAVGP